MRPWVNCVTSLGYGFLQGKDKLLSSFSKLPWELRLLHVIYLTHNQLATCSSWWYKHHYIVEIQRWGADSSCWRPQTWIDKFSISIPTWRQPHGVCTIHTTVSSEFHPWAAVPAVGSSNSAQHWLLVLLCLSFSLSRDELFKTLLLSPGLNI